MKKLLVLSILSTFLFSCGKEEVSYLYDKYDKVNYNAAATALQEKCLTENAIFKELDKTNNFSNFFVKYPERIFKIARKYTSDGSTERERVVFIRLDKNLYDSQLGQMDVIVTYSNSSETDTEFMNKKIIYTQKNNKELINTIATGVCASGNSYLRTSSWNNEYLGFSTTRKEIVKEDGKNFTRLMQSESLSLVSGYPAFFSIWNGTTKKETKANFAAEIISTDYKAVSKNIVQEITMADCDKLTEADQKVACNLLRDNNLKECHLVVDTAHYSSKTPSSMLTSFANCSSK